MGVDWQRAVSSIRAVRHTCGVNWVALLRGINVGGRSAVPMAELRRVFADCGCSSVSTYIASGNVLFASEEPDRAALTGLLEGAVDDAFGWATAVVLRTTEEIDRVASSHPFGADSSKSAVAFLAQEPLPTVVHSLAELEIAPEEFKVVGSDVLLHYPNGLGRAKLSGALLERRLGVSATIRNWRTVTKLAELSSATEG